MVGIYDVHPKYILMDEELTVTVYGDGFYRNDAKNGTLLRVRLTRIILEPDDTPLVHYVESDFTDFNEETPEQMTFIFPSGVFDDKDWVTVEVTFDDISWALSETVRLVIMKRPRITQVRPLYSYVGRENNEIFLEGGKYPSLEKGGDFWDTALYSYMRCNFTTSLDSFDTSNAIETDAYYINKTMVGCPLPRFDTRQTLKIDVTFDNGVFYTDNPINMYIVDAPVITALNNTEYYYVLRERVYITLYGSNLDQTGRVYVKVGETSQVVEIGLDSGDTSIIFEMPHLLMPGTYTI